MTIQLTFNENTEVGKILLRLIVTTPGVEYKPDKECEEAFRKAVEDILQESKP